MSSPRNTLKRAQLPADVNLCDYCAAKCCHYFALPIERPKKKRDYDFIRWYLLHERASVFVEDGTWYLLVHTVCKHLGDDYRCGIYETRPQICRDYSTNDCEYDDEWTYEQYFETPEQVAEYTEAVMPVAKGATSIRSPRPPLLPVVN